MANEKKADKGSEQQFAIQRVFVKDLSFESPESPMIFTQDWKPEMGLDINTASNKVVDDNYEVILTLTVSVKSGGKTAFIVEVKQAGIFTVVGFAEEDLKHTLGSFCPSILYPYAREVVTSAVMRGGFPQLVLAPVNFEALYQQHKDQGTGGEEQKETA